MNIFKNLLIRLGLRRISQQDVAQGIRERDLGLLKLIIRFGTYRERAAAALGLGKLRTRKAVPDLIRLLWDDFESVAQAARQGLQPYLPDKRVAYYLMQADQYWVYKKEQRSLKRKAIWYNTNNPLQPTAPLIDKSKMQRLAQVKVQLKKPMR